MKHYRTLGLDSLATMEEIKTAYRALAMKYHPEAVYAHKQKRKTSPLKAKRSYMTQKRPL